VSLKDFQIFNYFLEVKFKFKLTITSACTHAGFGSISSQLKPLTIYLLQNNDGVKDLFPVEVDGLILKVYDDKDWNVLTFGGISDSVSTLAINSFGRLPPPTNSLFCGEVTIDFTI
jgi:hypothetical protein